MGSPFQDRYLAVLRWDTAVQILLISAIGVIGSLSLGGEAMAAVLFLGMIWRTQTCRVRSIAGPAPSGWWMIVLVPLWPALVAVDAVWVWMQRMGFGEPFRVVVTAVLFVLAWGPFISGGSVAWVVVGTSGLLSAWMRRFESAWIALLPSVLPVAVLARI